MNTVFHAPGACFPAGRKADGSTDSDIAPPGQPVRSIRWTDRLEHEVDAALAAGAPGLEAVARRFAVSPRTLQRRLADEGTTWRRELERARHRRLLASAGSALTRDEQAALLGYADPASLRRALRRWAMRN
ncbi:hypothetical protein [Nocardia sp. NPDC057668]|uniref:hypothetical protein n=1 Tax=Nocardia sp. NPDC057668 TaxID=3346202 RepID=UPI003671CB1B